MTALVLCVVGYVLIDITRKTMKKLLRPEVVPWKGDVILCFYGAGFCLIYLYFWPFVLWIVQLLHHSTPGAQL